MRRPRFLLFAFVVLGCLVVQPALAADVVKERGGAANAFHLWKKREGGEERSRVIYLGGSITNGGSASKPDQTSYRGLVTKWIRDQFPKTPMIETNAAVSGTNSWLGAFRVMPEAINHYGSPDLVFVEFAVNDGGGTEAQTVAAMEGIVRQVWSARPNADIVFVYTLARKHLDAYKKGELPDTVRWHEKVADHYGIPSINVGAYVAEQINADKLKFEDFAKDDVHPTDRGYALYLEAIQPFLAKAKEQGAKAADVVKHTLPKPLSDRPLDKAKMVHYDRATWDKEWKHGQDSAVKNFLSVIACDQPGPVLSLKFTGDQVGYYDVLGPDCGDLEVSTDGSEWKKLANFDKHAINGPRPHSRILATGLDPAKEHEVKIRIAEKQPAESKGRFFRPGFFLVNGSVADPYQGLSVLEKIDKIYKGMEPVKFTPAADRWKFLPKTMKKLQEGPELKIVMLGDSIVNDTSSSQYQVLLERLYPKCKVVKQTSVRGSTGCWYYKNDNHVEEYVLKHKPDLLMIGGISQRDDVDSIKEVIKQVRAKCDCEIMVMTGAVGANGDPRKNKEWTFDIDPEGKDYRARLKRMAAEEKVEFLDMTGPWGLYIKDSGLSYGWFTRDPVHANDRGFQVLGRILEKFFSPK